MRDELLPLALRGTPRMSLTLARAAPALGELPMLVGTGWRTAAEQMDVQDPQDGALVARVPRATRDDVATALVAAEIGARAARHLGAHERIGVLRRAADRIEEQRDRFAEAITREGVKTIREARLEVARCVETLRISGEEARRLHGETLNFDQRPGSERRIGYWVREPIGIVVAITPFNDPLNLVAHKVGPAVAAGNAVIVKPHSRTPVSAILLAEALLDAGLPANVLQVITGHGEEIGDPLVADPRVAMVTFTGGREIGDHVVATAGRKKLSLELGANSPSLVLPDADLEAATAAIVSGAYWAAGQNCLHVQRVIAHHDVAGALRESLTDAARQVSFGDKREESTDMGPLIDEANAIRMETVVGDVLARGGRVLAGGRRHATFFEPTLVDMPLESGLAREEVFGPITGLVEATSLDEAIDIANGVDYGLHASIFTRDVALAMRAVRELRTGGVLVNDSTDYRIDAMPFGGVKGSGPGREGVAFAVDEMTTTKVVCLNL